MSLSRTVSDINGDLCRKSQIFPTPCISRPADEVPLELGIGAWVEKSSDGAVPKSFKIHLAV